MITRLGYLFHEARHSDGNRASLGFYHAICPPGGLYAGLQACDRAANGPYAVSALLIKNWVATCAACSAGAVERLRMQYEDYMSRLLDPRTATYWDDTPEGIR